MENNINIALNGDLPETIRGLTVANTDGTYTVVLNARHSRETLEKTLLHEVEHIKNGDVESVEDVNKIESEVRRKGG